MLNKSLILISLLFGLSTISFAGESNSTQLNTPIDKNTQTPDLIEEQIQKALLGISTLKVLKEGESKIIFESEAKVLNSDQPKKRKKRKKRKTRKRRLKRKNINIESLPLAKTYPMDYDLSKIQE
jgi:hypothetical protein